MIRTAALLAAIGTLLLTLMYAINSVIPIVRNLDVVAPLEAAIVFYDTVVPTAVWSVFFLMLWRGRDIRGIAIFTAVAAVAGPLVFRVVREMDTFSLLSADSIEFAVTGVAYALAWICVLYLWGRQGLKARMGALLIVLLMLTAIRGLADGGRAALAILDAVGGQLASFWDADPWQAFWRLLAVPGIRVYFWFSQVLFVLAARSAAHESR